MRDTSIELSFNSTNVYSLKTKRERERVKEQFILFQLIDLLFKDEKKKKRKREYLSALNSKDILIETFDDSQPRWLKAAYFRAYSRITVPLMGLETVSDAEPGVRSVRSVPPPTFSISRPEF